MNVAEKKEKEEPDYAGLSTETNPGSSTWVIDSGCTHHMTDDATFLQNMKALHPPKIVAGIGGRVVLATASGVVEGYLLKGNDYVRVKLDDVWFVPGLGRNLLSVKQIAIVTRDLVMLGPSTIQMKFQVNDKRITMRILSKRLYEICILPVIEEGLNVEVHHQEFDMN